MGLIKKILGRELLGWSSQGDTEIYPITHVGAVFDDNNVSLDQRLQSMQSQIEEALNIKSTLPINYFWAYIAANSEQDAIAALNRNDQFNPPTNYSPTPPPLQESQLLFMTTARKQGNSFLHWGDSTIWTSPIGIGSRYSSETGKDGDGYNYIYCRTVSATPPVQPANLTVENIEAASSNNQGIDVSGQRSDASYNVWYDHPSGVTGELQYEWIAVAKSHEGIWGSYSNAVLWSKYGVDGKDSEGVEYIYKSISSTSPVPDFGNTYRGQISGQGVIYDVPVSDCETDPNYQHDDFIPIDWSDEYQGVTQDLSRVYVSTRKKAFDNLGNGYWKAFSAPKLWAVYTAPTYIVTLSNDSSVIGNTDTAATINLLSYNELKVLYNDIVITDDSRFDIKITATPVNNINQLFDLCIVESRSGDTISIKNITDPLYIASKGWNYTFTASDNLINDAVVFCLNPTSNVTYIEDAYAIQFQVQIYEDSALIATLTKQQQVQVFSKSGVVTRLRGEWQVSTDYQYKTSDVIGENHTVYIDIVMYQGHYYQCIKTHTSTSNTPPDSTAGAEYWRLANEYEFIATKVLVADTAAVEVLNGGSLVVHDDTNTVTGGMSGGTNANNNDVIIWAGDTQNNKDSAPFRILEDGTLYSTQANISGVVNANSGEIGGFNITQHSIESTQGAYDDSGTSMNNTSFHLFSSKDNGGSFLGYTGSNQTVLLGLNCAAAGTSPTALRVEKSHAQPNVGIYLDIHNTQGSITSSDSPAIQVNRGCYAGFRPKITTVYSSINITNLDFFIIACADNCTITLPSTNVEIGQMYIIFPNSNTLIVSAGSTYIIGNSISTSTSVSLSGKNLYTLIYCYTGQTFNWVLGEMG